MSEYVSTVGRWVDEIQMKGLSTLVPRQPPSFLSLAVRKSGRGPGIFSHVSDIRIERMVEWFYCAWVH